MSVGSLHIGCPDAGTRTAGVSSVSASGACSGTSSGDASGKIAGRISQRVFDPYRERREFPERWAAWCRANFHSSVQLAASFSVSEKTARLWMEGVTAPQGWAVEPAKEGRVQVIRNGQLEAVPPFGAEAA